MMDTDILFRDGRRFTNDFNDIPSLTTNDLADSTSSDGVDTDTFTSEICSWNYDSGLVKNFELMLDRYDLDPLSTDDFHTVVEEWENSVKVEEEEGPVLDQKPLLTEFETLKEIDIKPTIIVKQERETSNDTNYDIVHLPTKIPGFDELVSVPFFEYPDNNFAVNDLPANLDLCTFINGEDITTPTEPKVDKPAPQRAPKFKAGRKRIDLKAQRYIVGDENEEEEEENVDVETVSEGGNNPVLEAGDLNSLLEQFEATEVEVNEVSADNSKDKEILNKEDSKFSPSNAISNAQTLKQNKAQHEQCKSEVKGKLPEVSSDQKKTEPQYVNVSNKKIDANEGKRQSSSLTVATTSNNKQIIEALPQELINRIKESGKRKRIAIIDPVPNSGGKRRKVQESSPLSRTVITSPAINPTIHANLHSIELDHSYCTVVTPVKKPIKKDSGYMSAEEEDKSLQNQPIVKNADGKLMISLLKVNTIKSNSEEIKKKKLNIEEYKKRRLGVLNTPTSSLSNSPMSSNCSSPLPAEDENTKRLRHVEKLRKMALELLNTPPKSSVNVDKSSSGNQIVVPIEKVVPSPCDMDVITYVSIGVNTDITGRNPLTPAEKLEEMKPLLNNASVKISSNSLINSLIENVPKVVNPVATIDRNKIKEVHGEDKTIIYLPKKRKLPETHHVGVQTSITLVGDNKRRYRRRKESTCSSSSSSSEIKCSKRSGRSHTSRYSKSSGSSRSASISSSSSRSSLRTRSRSTSRSPSPHRIRKRGSFDQEYIQEVEERRVVYVGKIASKTTKKDLYRRFSKFGPIKTISLHFRDHGDNYGFVTFENKLDAYKAIEHGNDDPYDIHYDLSFGGRRLFCKTSYSDLDNMRDDCGYVTPTSLSKPSGGESFDRLLREMQEKLKRRKV